MSSGGGFFAGAGATIGGGVVLTAIGFSLMAISETTGMIALVCMSVLQLAYVIPLYRNAKRTQNEGMKAGIIVGASLVFLFNASCGGLLLSLSNTSFR